MNESDIVNAVRKVRMAVASCTSGLDLMEKFYVGFNHPDNYKGLDMQLINGRLLRIRELLIQVIKEAEQK